MMVIAVPIGIPQLSYTFLFTFFPYLNVLIFFFFLVVCAPMTPENAKKS